MIFINEIELKPGRFGDGTLKCDLPPILYPERNTIQWCYDNDSELFTIQSVVDYIKECHPTARNSLVMPYIPHARQDRYVSERLFTLKTFTKIINYLNFETVYILDPHSDVSTALLDRTEELTDIMMSMGSEVLEFDAIMYPDAGAAKKYAHKYDTSLPVIIGNKIRNKDGRIEKYDLMNFPEGTKSVLIRDDICSYGGTFAAAAKELKARGVEKISLVVSHCEDNILKGDVLNWVDEVYTSDSICKVKHPKLHFIREYRIFDEE